MGAVPCNYYSDKRGDHKDTPEWRGEGFHLCAAAVGCILKGKKPIQGVKLKLLKDERGNVAVLYNSVKKLY